jgi:hypothetical protein
MSAADVFHRARAAGVELSMTPAGNIRWRCLGGLPDDLRRSIAAHKQELLRLLDAKETKPADWDAESWELIRFFQESRPRLPTAPFRLTPWLYVENPAGWYKSLELDISFGPLGCRARMGTLQEDLRLLREHMARMDESA